MTLRPCLTPGCPRLVRRGRCRLHTQLHTQAANAARRMNAVRKVYGSKRWIATRARAIRRAGGRCQMIENGERCTAVERLHGHHFYEGGVEQMLVDGVDPFDERWVVVLCGPHHQEVEARNRRNHSFRR